MMMSPGLLTLGVLGPEFGLSVNESIWLSVIATATGCIIPAFTATLCAPLGLRQIAASRYAFGIWGAKLCGVLNIITNIGFGTISCIVAGQLLSAVSNGSLTIAVGIVVVVVGACAISFFGFRIVQIYESFAWILIGILLCVQFGQSSKYFTRSPGTSLLSGLDRTGAALTYFAIVFGQSAAWCSISGDYYVHYSPNINKWLVFSMTWTGLTLSTCFVVILGVYYGGIIKSNEIMATVYEEGGIGALILATMRPSSWAKFACTLYAISFSE
jgi:purine-cytosine permease-like protein